MARRPAKFHQPYSDEDLIIILSDAPTKANALKHASRFERSAKAIEMIYRWAMSSKGTIAESGREDHVFIQQIRRVAKDRVGWLS